MPSCAPKEPGALCSWLLKLNKESGGGLRLPLHFRKMKKNFQFFTISDDMQQDFKT